MSKIKNSEYIDIVNNWLSEGVLSYSEIVIALRKRGFTISKASVAKYAQEFRANKAAISNIDIDSEVIKIKSKEVDFRNDLENGVKLINEMLNDALKNAYQLTLYAKEHKKPPPIHAFKAAREIQQLLKGQRDLLQNGLEKLD